MAISLIRRQVLTLDYFVGKKKPIWLFESFAMINSIRAVRRAKGLTLEEVGARCDPPTTAQTIGRLETGTRNLSLGWMNRIAAALGVDAAELVQLPQDTQLTITAHLGADGAHAPTRVEQALTARPAEDMVAVRVTSSIGDYRAGDEIWCRRIEGDWTSALNRDLLVPRPAGRFFFARLLNVDGEKLHLLPLGTGARQQVVSNPPWAAVAVRLIRTL
jgi:transcriptional regulator with XRE-family HTH domain